MAKKTVTVLTDDLDGKEIEHGKGESVSFALDGQSYEIDLTKKNAETLRKVLKPYVDVAAKVSKTTKRGKAGKVPSGPKPSEVREWAKQQGLEVPDRGRIPQHIYDAWEAK